MRIRFVFALIVGALVVSPVSAQNLGGPARLLWLDTVQAELKLTPQQVVDGKKISQEIQNKYAKDYAQLQESAASKKAAAPELRKQAVDLRKRAAQDVEQRLAKVLKPGQNNRLKQINLQVLGVQAFADGGVQKALTISDDQRPKLRSIVEASANDVQETVAEARGNFAETSKKVAALRKEAMTKALAVLTTDQSAKWMKLTGAPFELDLGQVFNILDEEPKPQKQ